MKTTTIFLTALMLSLSVFAQDWGDSGYGGTDWGDSGWGGTDWGDSGYGGTDWGDSGYGGSDWGDSGTGGINDWNTDSGDLGGSDTTTTDWNNDGGTPPNTDWNPPIPNPNPFVNQAPTLNAIGPRTVFEEQTLAFTVSGSDPDGQSITFSASNLPSGASFTGQIFSWTPNSNQQGTYFVTFTVTDSMGAQDSETVQITVLDVVIVPPPAVNHAPVFLSEPVTSAFIRQWYFAQVIVFDEDGDDISLSLDTAPFGMDIYAVNTGYTVFSSWIDEGDTESEDTITGETLTVTMNGITETACDVTINDVRRTVPYQAGFTHQVTVDGATYYFTVEPDFDYGDCYIEITDARITTAWLFWLPEPFQFGSNPVSIHANDGHVITAQNFNVTVTVDPRSLPKADEPRGPRKDIHVNTIALPDEARAGETVFVTLNFENSGDLKLDGAEATISIPELGIRSPTIGPLDLRINKDVSRTLALEIPSDAADGLYMVRVTIDSGSVHRIVHRDIEIVSD